MPQFEKRLSNNQGEGTSSSVSRPDLKKFEAVTTPPQVWQEVTDSIRDKLDLGFIKPGESISSERALVEDLQVARPTVQQAIRTLQGEQRIEITRKNKGGAEVKRRDPGMDIPRLTKLSQQEEQIEQAFDLREAIEPHVTRLAVRHITDEDLMVLEESVQNMTHASESLQTAAQTLAGEVSPKDQDEATKASEDEALNLQRENYTFHRTLADVTENPMLVNTLHTLYKKTLLPIDVFYRQGGKQQDEVGEHNAVISAIANQNEDAAANAMRTHIKSTRQSFRQRLGNK